LRLNINLASKPYLDVRRTLARWSAPVLLLALCTAALVWLATASWIEAREMNAKIGALTREVAALERRHDEAVALLRLSRNRSVVETSVFLNGLIARKSFSWTQAFMQLEKIMPPGLRVVSISPALEPQTNSVQVMLSVAGSSRESALELVRRLEQSPSYQNARIVEEKAESNRGSGDTVVFHLAALYVATPETAPEAQTDSAPDASEEGAVAAPQGSAGAPASKGAKP
jgi:type IV pilus assembly protein PilN